MGWRPGSASWNPRLMLNNAGWVIPSRTSPSLRDASRRCHMLLMKTKNQIRMQGLVDGLQDKIKSYKKQIEEAEEIAALNLAKFRNPQAQAIESAELADVNEKALAKAKAKARGASVGL